jgi:Flp pilus assembly protein TadG
MSAVVERRGGRSDRGSATVELVTIAPLLVALLAFIVYAGRAGQTVEQVHHAADQGARAASMVRRPAMGDAARSAVLADLAANGVACDQPSVATSVRVDSVTVQVVCRVPTVGLRLLGADARSVSATSTEVIDRYRGGP